jgi:hypothetical protein
MSWTNYVDPFMSGVAGVGLDVGWMFRAEKGGTDYISRGGNRIEGRFPQLAEKSQLVLSTSNSCNKSWWRSEVY